MSDLFSEVRNLAADLESIGLGGWGIKLTDAIDAGSTGSEIQMAIRWHLQALLREVPSLPLRNRQMAEKLIQDINATGA